MGRYYTTRRKLEIEANELHRQVKRLVAKNRALETRIEVLERWMRKSNL
tara:strand:- start:12101 stop:12247 length:147 start_codon:yes stop_codon:yes gene_type:complete